MDDLPVGRYGTVHYMSNTGTEVPIASYPIDEPVITIGGKDQHIRLYDPWVSDLHCKLIFEEGKAFLVVLGQNGVAIDGSNFAPSQSDASPTTVPLTNGSEWLIFKRRFIFQYPPKDQRAKLIATPKAKSRKSLRMSMINSAQLWTPTVPKTQAESLRMLKTPIKPYTEGKDKDLFITLVEGDALHVARNQEEVVVVESVDTPPEEIPNPIPAPTIAATPRKASQTPGRQPRSSLHRQVLLMNSHRKQVQLDEMEEQEVEASILNEEPSDEEPDEYEEDFEEDEGSNPFLERDHDLSLSTNESNDSTEPNPFSADGMDGKSFRASLGAIGSIRPFGRPSGAVFHSPAPNEKVSGNQQPEDGYDDKVREEPSTPSNKRPLGSFLTPQVSRAGSGILPRQSVGGPSRYMDLDDDLEQARQRLAGLGTAPSRPQTVQLNEASQSTSTPSIPQSIKRGRASLAAIPELASPMPSARGRFSLAAIPEPKFEEFGPNQSDIPSTPKEEGSGDPSLRLQKLMRTVEDVARRESIREARRSLAGPVDFYTPSSSTNGTTLSFNPRENRSHRNGSSESHVMNVSTDTYSLYPDTTIPSLHKDESTMFMDDSQNSREVDVDSMEEEVPKKKVQNAAKAGKKTAPKKKTHAPTPPHEDDEMQVDEPEISPPIKEESSEDVVMEEEPVPKSKATQRTRRGATPDVSSSGTTATRRGRPKKVESSDDEPSIAENTTSTRKGKSKANTNDTTLETISEDSTAKTASKSRRGVKATTTEPEATETSRTTTARRGGRGKAAAAIPVDEEDSSALNIPAPATKAAAGRGRKAKAASKEVEDGVDSMQDEDEIDSLPRTTSTRRTARSRTTPQPQSQSQQEIAESSQDTEDMPAPKKTARKAATTTTRKLKAESGATRSDKENASMDSDVLPAPAKAAPRTRKKAAAVEETSVEASTQTTTKRTTRTKR